MSRVYIERFERPEELRQKIAQALKWLGMNEIIAPGALVFIKPNVTWRIPTPGVTVTPAFLPALTACYPSRPISPSENRKGGRRAFRRKVLLPPMAVCEIMQIDPPSIGHHRLALKENIPRESLQEITFNHPPRDFSNRKFHLRRSSSNYIHLAAFKNVTLNKLFYDPIFADALHEFLWLIRKHPLISLLLYGRLGRGEANRGGREV